ncbi:hypothetical protein CW304_21915 [Bacillus sp. UFRGS-B20]|nr:hypothetical protein CW304_21915 [Bacillus sp. UFRGS-B20]
MYFHFCVHQHLYNYSHIINLKLFPFSKIISCKWVIQARLLQRSHVSFFFVNCNWLIFILSTATTAHHETETIAIKFS